ncbi:MAG: DUF4114 domain-containing protein [Gammaproteobacteria bacterium]|jgi:hypothetical protein
MKKLGRYLLIPLLSGVHSFAQASTTPIMSSPNEPDLLGAGGILDSNFGLGNLQYIDGDFDQMWVASSSVDIAVIAKHAGFTHNIGHIDASDKYTSLLSSITSSSGQSASFDKGNSGSPFRFGLEVSGGPLYSSFMNDNPDTGEDHMVSWRITGGQYAGDFVMAWEDLPNLGDRDYNDLVLRVSGVTAVPVPATVWLFISGLIGVAAIARRKAS